ncbi:C/H/G cyclin, partial [Meredithblackwellia eburnea MCA 4105]
MAANFYLSSHANYHLHPRSALMAARAEDLKYATEEELGWIEIWSGTFIQKLCRRLSLRQQVIGTASVYFRRFYLRNSYSETDVPLVAAACCYVAAKAEETPVHVKSAVAEAREICNEMGHRTFPGDNTRLAEMEFYLIEELDFHLIIYHPYRSLVQICGRDGGPNAGGEQGKERRESMLEMDDAALQMAWFVINDTYRSSLCLVYPPHLIALAAIYLGFALEPPPSAAAIMNPPQPPPPLPDDPSDLFSLGLEGIPVEPPAPLPPKPAVPQKPILGGKTDPITFLSSLNVDHTLVWEIVQEILSLYELWNILEVSTAAKPKVGAGGTAG